MIDAINIKLTPEEIRQKLTDVIKTGNNDSTISIIDGLIDKDALDEVMANKINDMIFNDPKNSNNTTLLKLKDEKLPNLDKLNSVIDNKPFINDNVKSLLKDIISTLSDSQIKDVFNAALANPAFLDALKKSTNADSETQGLIDGLSKLNLSIDEIRTSLINADNKSIDFASANNKIMSKYQESNELNDKVTKILNDISNNNKIKDKDNILNQLSKTSDNVMKLYSIDGNKDIKDALKDNLINYANKTVSTLSEDKLKNSFNEINKDPSLIKLLMEANPGLKDKIAGNVSNFISPNGKDIKMNEVIDLDKIKNMMDTTTTSNGFASKSVPKLNCNTSANKCYYDGKELNTFGDIEKLGINPFNKINPGKLNDLLKSAVESAKNEQELTQEKIVTGDNSQLNQAILQAQNEMSNKIENIIGIKLKEKTQELYEKFKQLCLQLGTEQEIQQIQRINNDSKPNSSFMQMRMKESNTNNLLCINKPNIFDQAIGYNDFNTFLELKYKTCQELNLTNEIDTLISTAIKRKFIKNDKLMEIKIYTTNYIQKITNPDLGINE